MAEGTIAKTYNPLYLGSITASSLEDAMSKAFDAIPLDSVVAIGTYNYNGAWMFLAYKYGNGLYGSMIAMTFNSNYVRSMIVNNGSKTIKALALV